MLTTLAFIVAPILVIAGLFVAARARRRSEANAMLRSAVSRSEAGLPEFDGARAIILAKHYVQAGTDPEGNDTHLKARFLCKMPGNSFFQVAIEGAHAQQSAMTTISKLSEKEAEYLRTRHPYSRRRANDA